MTAMSNDERSCCAARSSRPTIPQPRSTRDFVLCLRVIAHPEQFDVLAREEEPPAGRALTEVNVARPLDQSSPCERRRFGRAGIAHDEDVRLGLCSGLDPTESWSRHSRPGRTHRITFHAASQFTLPSIRRSPSQNSSFCLSSPFEEVPCAGHRQGSLL
jgi:hypothetical protein